ncbi:MAG: hypothetical protein ACI4D2_03170 [Lachnospiraceae bacterium]
MRKQNSEFITAFTSEAESDLKNTDYFGFVELDSFACYVIADGIDDQMDASAARLAVSAAVTAFSEAPSMSKRTIKACMKAANRALLEARSKRKLKASVIIILTNYIKFRYGQAGNIRLRLFRNGFIKVQSTDQSLTADLVREEKVELDKVARHEERNNLFAYLGQEKEFHPYISKKVKLTDADAITLATRGVWEHIDDGELKDIMEEATDNPQDTVDRVEDMLLSGQPKNLGKYTFVTLFVNKIFTDPNRKRRIRRIIMTVLPIMLALAVLMIVLAVRHNRRVQKKEQMELRYMDTIEYIQTDNYVRAREKCEEALALAEELKDAGMQKELGSHLKLIETVLAAEEALDREKYAEAQKNYQEAAKRSKYVDRMGMDYIEDKLTLTANYMAVYDLINLGDTLAFNLQYDKAEEKYLEAKAIAGKIYFDAGRQSAMDALEKLYTDQKAEKEAEKEEVKVLLAKQESAVNFVAQGNEAFAKGDYETAKVYYASAEQAYEELGEKIQKEAAAKKLAVVEDKLARQEAKRAEAEDFGRQAEQAAKAQDYLSAKKYYLLAKDIYASLEMNEEVDEMTRKMEALGIKSDAAQEKAAQEEKAKEEAQKAGSVSGNGS